MPLMIFMIKVFEDTKRAKNKIRGTGKEKGYNSIEWKKKNDLFIKART